MAYVQYCSVEDVLNYLNLLKEVPDYSSQITSKEVVGTGNGVQTIFLLDHANIVPLTYYLYYGATEAAALALTETTHYTLDMDSGKITLTAAGVTLIATNNIYAAYKWSDYKTSEISGLCDKATEQIDGDCKQTWQLPTLVTREEKIGFGINQKQYRVSNLPIYVVRPTLTTTVADSDLSFVLSSVTGIDSGDYLIIDSEVVLVGTVTVGTNTITVTRAKFGTSAASHTAGTELVNVIVELSRTPIGTVPTWEVKQFRADYEVSDDTSYVTLLNNSYTNRGMYVGDYPPKGLPNRVRITYKFGHATPDHELKLLSILYVVREFVNKGIFRALLNGIDGFNPQTASMVDARIADILKTKKLILADGF